MNSMRWESKWNNAKECLPQKSGRYLISLRDFDDKPYIVVFSYSNKFKKFNVRDTDESDELSIDVDYWAEICQPF